MTGLWTCVGGWLVLNAALVAVLMLRRDQAALRDPNPTDSPSRRLRSYSK